MNKKVIIIIAVLLTLGIAGGVFAYSQSSENQDNQEKSETGNDLTLQSEASSAEAQEDAAKKDTPSSADDSMSTQGTYITLADYDSDKAKYNDSKKVYFFHASWCPICQSIEKEINSDASKIPKGVTLIKTDFDSSTDLRKKYGVTTQYTFVQIDNDGNQQAKWSATSLDDAIAGIN